MDRCDVAFYDFFFNQIFAIAASKKKFYRDFSYLRSELNS